MAPDTTPPGGATRYLETSLGILMPPVDLVPTDPPGGTAYRAALRAGDSLDWRPLMRVWQQRFEQFTERLE
jgi:hypothetical protein